MEEKAPWYVVTSRIIFLLLLSLWGYTFTVSFGVLLIAAYQEIAVKFDIEELLLFDKLIRLIMEHPTGTTVAAVIGYLAYIWYVLTAVVKMYIRKHSNEL